MMTIQDLRDRGLIVLEVISGSRAYGLELPHSDTDLKGVFVLPKEEYYGYNYIKQVSSEKNDEVFYELGRFFKLLKGNNPNILEILGTPADCILHKHPLMDDVRPELFLSKLCKDSFGNYALSQIKKAKGLNKKINKPMDKERKDILNYCYVTEEGASIPLLDWLSKKGLTQEACGLAAVDHMRDLYALYVDSEGSKGYKGIATKEVSNEVSLSSIPKGETPETYLYFNKDGYSFYCKEYKAYWEWVEKRNEARYQSTMEHGKNYDAKNMMHVFRLIEMAAEIGEGKGILTRRPNREELLKIRRGEYEYEELLERAERKMREIEGVYERSGLMEEPEDGEILKVLVRMREGFNFKTH